MSTLCYVLSTLYLIWTAFICKTILGVLKSIKYTETYPEGELPDKFKYFARYDRKKWQMWQIYFCMVFLAPARCLLGNSKIILKLALVVVSIANIFSHIALVGIPDN